MDDVGEANGAVDVLGEDQGGKARRLDQRGDGVATVGARRFVERGKGLVEQQQAWFDRDSPGQSDATSEAERHLSGKMIAMFGDAEAREQRIDLVGARAARRCADCRAR